MPDTKNVPIRWGKYIDHDMEDKKVMFIGAEKAIYDSNGRRLDEKLVDMEGSLSDAFSETKDYAVGEYCVYTNRVFKFTKAKTAGEWDGTAVIPVSLAQEISEVSRGIAALNSHLQYINLKATETILDFVINHKNDRVVGFTLSGQFPSDSPENQEFYVISEKDEGSNRIKVILLPYQTSLDYIYVRRIFHDSWTDSSWSKREYVAKSALGNTNNMQLMQAYPDNIDDPPLAIILQAHLNNTLGTLPTEIGGTVFLILQSNPTIRYKQYNSQLAFGFGGDKIAFRRRSGGGWTEWKYLTFP